MRTNVRSLLSDNISVLKLMLKVRQETGGLQAFTMFSLQLSRHIILITIKLLDFVHRPDFNKQKTRRFGNWIFHFFISYPLVTSHGLFLRSGVYSPLFSSG
jgi:hypothetical protein